MGSKDSLLCNGTYYVTVSDVNQCAVVAQYTIHSQSNLTSHIQNVHFPSCSTLNNGYIQIQAEGGLSPYTYLWSTQPPQTTNTATNLGEGTYYCTVTDALGCQVIDSMTLYYANIMTVNAQIQDPLCGPDGAIILQVNGSVSPYSYSWNGYPHNFTNMLTNLSEWTYDYTVTDAYGCQITQQVTLTNQSTPIVVNVTGITDYCEGESGGRAIINVSGGTPPYYDGYHYFSSIDTILNLYEDSHMIYVSDSNNCSDSIQVNVVQKPKPYVTGLINNSNCGMADGVIVLQVTSGIAPYDYVWSNGLVLTNSNNSVVMNPNLPVGVYSVTVTQANGCSVDTFFVVQNQTSLSLVVDSIVPPSCVNYTDACVIAHAENGTPPYTYNWANGCNSTTCCGLGSGYYAVTVNDATNCSQVAVVTLPQGQQPLVEFSYTQQQNTITFVNQSTPGNYLWMFGDGTNSTEANPIHSYSNDGQYTVCLILYSCDTLITCHNIIITGVGIDEWLANPIAVYPNPANNYFVVKLNSPHRINLQMYNVIMQKIIDKNIDGEEKIYIDNLPTGIYFIQLISNDKQTMIKLLIER